MKSIFNNIIKIIYGIFIAIFTIGVSTIAVLNAKFIYYNSIDKYGLDKLGNLSKEMLIKDYDILIRYLQNPFIDKLNFNNFSMSVNGEIHFYEVKNIFLSIYLITICIGLFFTISLIIKRIKGKKINLYKKLNYGANTLIVIIISLLSAMFIDFSKAFVIFHKIFFNNDYWIFDERTDPIIKVLPEEVFMLYALIIVILVIIAVVVYKFYYYYKKKKS
ncbi:MAG: TIGR01906 family membrane protein [Clostridium sp.]|nr:TIGR01906 family membrane protein [Clostridium sp.]